MESAVSSVEVGVPWPHHGSVQDGIAVSTSPPLESGRGDVVEAPPPEADILDALERGDRRTALALLMDVYGSALYAFCRNMVRDADLAADVHQTTFVQAWQGLEHFSHRSTLRTWLYGIARHRCLDALKIDRRRNRRFELVDSLPENEGHEPEAEKQLVAGAFSRALNACLAALAPRVRLAVALRFEEGFSYPEMASVCDDRPATLQARVSRALPALRRCLEEKGLAP